MENAVTTEEKIIKISTKTSARYAVPYLFEADQAEDAMAWFRARNRAYNVYDDNPTDKMFEMTKQILADIKYEKEDGLDDTLRYNLEILNIDFHELAGGRVVLLCPLTVLGGSKPEAQWLEPKGGRKLKQSEFFTMVEAEGGAPEPRRPADRQFKNVRTPKAA